MDRPSATLTHQLCQVRVTLLARVTQIFGLIQTSVEVIGVAFPSLPTFERAHYHLFGEIPHFNKTRQKHGFSLSTVPISNVTLMAKATNLVEFNDTAVFMCSISNGSFPSYVWMNGSSVVTASGDLHLSNENATLTIVNVTRYDEGPFMCNVSNGVSYQVSPPVFLNISCKSFKQKKYKLVHVLLCM